MSVAFNFYFKQVKYILKSNESFSFYFDQDGYGLQLVNFEITYQVLPLRFGKNASLRGGRNRGGVRETKKSERRKRVTSFFSHFFSLRHRITKRITVYGLMSFREIT